jgi:hypothetical protein
MLSVGSSRSMSATFQRGCITSTVFISMAYTISSFSMRPYVKKEAEALPADFPRWKAA